jgi:anti-sigma-K factor RskA
MNETEHDRWRDELAAFALGALEPGEAAELERHLAGCGECRAELDWLRPAVHQLPESVPRAEPPPELRARLMEQVRSEAGPSQSTASPDRPARWTGRRLGLRPLVGLATAALLVAALAGYAISGGDSGGDGTSTVITGNSPGVTAQMVRQGETGTLRLANLHQLPPNKVLQAWVQRGKRVVSAKTLFVPNSDGTATATIDGMDGVSAVMVTAEPRGGSTQPTSTPIVSMAIPN